MDGIVSWIETIIAVMLFTILIELILPDGKTKKYVQLVTGLLITVAIINPLINVVQGKTDFNSLVTKNTNYLSFKEIEANTMIINQKQDNLIYESYKENIKQDIIKEVNKNKYDVVDIYIEINSDKNNFGIITKLNLQLNKIEEKEGKIESVKKISVGAKKEITENQEVYQKDIILLREILYEKYNIDVHNIQISIINL